ncbi:phosphopantetheine-binding protein [Streptomyces sp. AD681]|uniref:Acyl carrier protein n=1 Tax=Streptomyces rubrogriseus TaxID=194673 RepID=A0A6G3TEB7_9ACTN|nr:MULTISPECIES: phosphopantetheine-binding protein [Streptomyces]MDA5144699.1 phosphopantetheine-binding protein [Streptomyces sp. AD681]MYS71303.1 acyl carrier protein [Streptomyces sp. SID5926]NEC34795.1 acyl carrier protein [Streptomyces rubrogriseus]
MEILVVKAGLPRSAVTADPGATMSDVDLDSLAYLQLRVEIEDRHGIEIGEEYAKATFGELVRLVNEGLSEHAR